MKNKILGLGLLAGGAAAIYYFYKQSQKVSIGEAPSLEYKEVAKEPLTVLDDGTPVYMTREGADKIMYDVKSLEDNRFYLNPNEMYTEEYFQTDSGKKLKETLSPLTNIKVGQLSEQNVTNINNIGKLPHFDILEMNALLKKQQGIV